MQLELSSVLGHACGSSAWVQIVVACHAWCLATFPDANPAYSAHRRSGVSRSATGERRHNLAPLRHMIGGFDARHARGYLVGTRNGRVAAAYTIPCTSSPPPPARLAATHVPGSASFTGLQNIVTTSGGIATGGSSTLISVAFWSRRASRSCTSATERVPRKRNGSSAKLFTVVVVCPPIPSRW